MSGLQEVIFYSGLNWRVYSIFFHRCWTTISQKVPPDLLILYWIHLTSFANCDQFFFDNLSLDFAELLPIKETNCVIFWKSEAYQFTQMGSFHNNACLWKSQNIKRRHLNRKRAKTRAHQALEAQHPVHIQQHHKSIHKSLRDPVYT